MRVSIGSIDSKILLTYNILTGYFWHIHNTHRERIEEVMLILNAPHIVSIGGDIYQVPPTNLSGNKTRAFTKGDSLDLYRLNCCKGTTEAVPVNISSMEYRQLFLDAPSALPSHTIE